MSASLFIDGGQSLRSERTVCEIGIHLRAQRLSAKDAELSGEGIGSQPSLSDFQDKLDRIPFGGPSAAKDLQLLYAFHVIALEFKNGATSSNDIGKRFSELDLAGKLDEGLPSSPTAVSVRCNKIKVYFGRALGMPGLEPKAPLFEIRGTGLNMLGLTPLGDLAWKWAKRRLAQASLIEETV
jgi:hypothetical protein